MLRIVKFGTGVIGPARRNTFTYFQPRLQFNQKRLFSTSGDDSSVEKPNESSPFLSFSQRYNKPTLTHSTSLDFLFY